MYNMGHILSQIYIRSSMEEFTFTKEDLIRYAHSIVQDQITSLHITVDGQVVEVTVDQAVVFIPLPNSHAFLAVDTDKKMIFEADSTKKIGQEAPITPWQVHILTDELRKFYYVNDWYPNAIFALYGS